MLTLLSQKNLSAPVVAVAFALSVLFANGQAWWLQALTAPIG